MGFDQPYYDPYQQAYADPFSIYDDMVFWLVIGSIAGLAIKVWIAYAGFKSFRQLFDPFSRQREKSYEEQRLEASERKHRACLMLGAACLIGAVILFMYGPAEAAGSMSVGGVTVKNATPGTILAAVGVVITLHVIKQKHDD